MRISGIEHGTKVILMNSIWVRVDCNLSPCFMRKNMIRHHCILQQLCHPGRAEASLRFAGRRTESLTHDLIPAHQYWFIYLPGVSGSSCSSLARVTEALHVPFPPCYRLLRQPWSRSCLLPHINPARRSRNSRQQAIRLLPYGLKGPRAHSAEYFILTSIERGPAGMGFKDLH